MQSSQVPSRIRTLNRLVPQGFGRWRLNSAEALEASARKSASTAEELPTTTRTALTELIRSYQASARLHPLGEIITAVNLIALLRNQLNVNAALANDARIAQRAISAPLIITGLPRTGSTLLHNLLALDPQWRVPHSWEVNYPLPAPDTAVSQVRKERKTQRLFQLIEALHPGFRAIHELHAKLPQECLVIMASAMRSHQFFSSSFVPDYQDWLDEQPPALAYEHHRATLQLRQGEKTTLKAWALKAPSHLFSMGGLLTTYPDCRIVYTKRAPEQVVGSIASLHWHLYRTFSNFADTRELGRQVCQRWGNVQQAFEAQLNASNELRARTCSIDYAELIQDPIATIRKIYRQFGLSLNDSTAAIMQNHLHQRPLHHFGKHRYALADFGLTVRDIDQAF